MQYFSEAVLIDTSAVLALFNRKDAYHLSAKNFFSDNSDFLWVSINATAHESFTRARYDLGFPIAIDIYNFLINYKFYHINFVNSDANNAKSILIKYSDHVLSFHDALCAAIMKRFGIYKVFTYDKHFYAFGFQVFPGFN